VLHAHRCPKPIRITSPLVAELAGPDARRKWELFSIKDRRTVVASLVDVTINKLKHGATRRFDPLDVEVTWKASESINLQTHQH
jgi:hypothetical protein